MKIQTNYDQMTDEQLYEELRHRVETFYAVIDQAYRRHFEVDFHGEIGTLEGLSNNSILLHWFQDINEKEEIVPNHRNYRSLLLAFLTVPFRILGIERDFATEVSQEQFLQRYECSICRKYKDDSLGYYKVPDMQQFNDHIWTNGIERFQYQDYIRQVNSKLEDEQIYISFLDEEYMLDGVALQECVDVQGIDYYRCLLILYYQHEKGSTECSIVITKEKLEELINAQA